MILPQQTYLDSVKIQLLESKQDYVEAFMLHLNSASLKKQLFKWIFETLAKLTQKDSELKRAKATKEEVKSGMDFQAGKGERMEKTKE